MTTQATPQWYVVHTYSGHEKKVQASLQSKVESLEMQDLILDIEVPMEDSPVKKDNKVIIKKRKLFPGYVIVKMIMNEDTWFVVRNTRGVTGFVGPGSTPVALSEEELRHMGIVEKKPNVNIEFAVGDEVCIIDGPFADYNGIVKAINYDKGLITVEVNMFVRLTSIEFEAYQIEKL